METTNAILLRKRKLRDTSLIISWCTEWLGCVDTVAKGARRPKSVFAGKLDFFSRLRSSSSSRRSSLHTLTEVVLRNPFGGIRQNYLRTRAASYFVELIEISTEPEHPAPELFHLLQRAFGFSTHTTRICARCGISRRSWRGSPECITWRSRRAAPPRRLARFSGGCHAGGPRCSGRWCNFFAAESAASGREAATVVSHEKTLFALGRRALRLRPDRARR